MPSCTSYTYDNAGNRKSLALANGITVQYNYDTLNRLTSISQAKIPATPIGVFTYTLNAANLRTDLSETVNGNSSTLHWNYDNAYRLITETSAEANAYIMSWRQLGKQTKTLEKLKLFTLLVPLTRQNAIYRHIHKLPL